MGVFRCLGRSRGVLGKPGWRTRSGRPHWMGRIIVPCLLAVGILFPAAPIPGKDRFPVWIRAELLLPRSTKRGIQNSNAPRKGISGFFCLAPGLFGVVLAPMVPGEVGCMLQDAGDLRAAESRNSSVFLQLAVGSVFSASSMRRKSHFTVWRHAELLFPRLAIRSNVFSRAP
eukprot:gene14966-biopygen17144